MTKTKHFQHRMSQRAINQKLVDMVLEFGKTEGDKIYLNRKGLTNMIDCLNHMKQIALRGLEKGGVVVIESNGSLITTYRMGD